ncbi:nuclear transport factor 2 family protein [Glycomyces paridis]|uniref:Nuclear transport factor 2 family protein n=1 Tax=Glycomyces paridis TaxID=2126555 RepID=A0A4S8PHU6_9ACTN|nr:nuclear transport factor 2 family protein [Glycomyces paridis]THV29531.1 nuclear transport factor 2 family protein [Glycomyces paridis]
MSEPAEDSLAAAESALQRAQLAGDVVALEALLHPDVVYVGPDGAEFGRAQDLESHASGQLKLTSLEQIQGAVRRFGSAGVTRTRVKLAGLAAGEPFAAAFVYTRTWLFQDGRWQVVQAQGAVLPPSA